MKVKRFVDNDSRSVMAKVRAEMGPDAVILVSRNVDGRFEMVAAIDFDEKEFEALAGQTGIPEISAEAAKEQPKLPLVESPVAQTHAVQDANSQASIEHDTVTPAAVGGSAILPAAADEIADQSMPVKSFPDNQSIEKPSPEVSPLITDCSLNELQSGLAKMREMLVQELSRLPSPNAGPTHEVTPALVNQLLELGLSAGLCEDIVDELKLSARGPDAWNKARQLICSKIGECGNTAIDSGGIYAFIGSTGVGKTTAIQKLAALYVECHGRGEIGLITTDCYRIGGQEQLEVFAKYLGIPMMVATSQDEIERALNFFSSKKLVLIDTAGLGQKDVGLRNQYKMLSSSSYDIKPYLVLPATAHTAILSEIVQAFGEETIAGTIVSKVDESSCLGSVIDVLVQHKLKLAYIGIGQRVPDDLAYGKAEELLSWAHSLTRQVDDEAANDAQIVKVVG